MAEQPTFRIVDVFPYLDREEEYPGLTLEEAAARMDDLTGVGADTIIADWEEPCVTCKGEKGQRVCGTEGEGFALCGACGGSGKRSQAWEWISEETGREVIMRREVAL